MRAEINTVAYSDPYGKETVVLSVKDKEIGKLEGTMEFLSEDTRKTQNLERKERYHTECSLDAMSY